MRESALRWYARSEQFASKMFLMQLCKRREEEICKETTGLFWASIHGITHETILIAKTMLRKYDCKTSGKKSTSYLRVNRVFIVTYLRAHTVLTADDFSHLEGLGVRRAVMLARSTYCSGTSR